MSTITTEQVLESIVTDEQAAELERATTVTLGDLVRLGSSHTAQAFNWGKGGDACALSAGALGFEAIQRL